jgi:dynein heavy chain
MEALYSIEQEGLIHYDKENIHPNVIIALDPYLKDKEFDPEFIRCQSSKTFCLRH